MAQKHYSDEDVLKLLREIDVHLHVGLDVVSACRKAGISERRPCAALDVARSSLRYQAKPTDDTELRLAMIRLAK